MPGSSRNSPSAQPSTASRAQGSHTWGGRRATEVTPHTQQSHTRVPNTGQSCPGNASLLCHSHPRRWHWQGCPHGTGFALGCLCCVWSPDPALPSRATTTAGFLLCLSTHMNLKFLHSQGSVNLGVAPPKATIAGQGCGLITTFEKHPSVPTPKSFSTQISLPASSHQLLQRFLWES